MRSQLFCHGLCKTELWIYALEILGNCNRLPTSLILFDERHVDVPRQFGVTVISGRRRGMRIPKFSQQNEHAFTSKFIYEIHLAATQPQRPNIRSFWEPRAQRWEETIRRNHLVTSNQSVKDVFPYVGAERPVFSFCIIVFSQLFVPEGTPRATLEKLTFKACISNLKNH